MTQQSHLDFDLSAELVAVLDAYQAAHAPSTRDEAVAAAIRALQDREAKKTQPSAEGEQSPHE